MEEEYKYLFDDIESHNSGDSTASSNARLDFGKLTRSTIKISNIESDFHEGYLEKKSPTLFVKWQVMLINELKLHRNDISS